MYFLISQFLHVINKLLVNKELLAKIGAVKYLMCAFKFTFCQINDTKYVLLVFIFHHS